MRDWRPRGNGGDRRTLCGQRARRVQVGPGIGDEAVSGKGDAAVPKGALR